MMTIDEALKKLKQGPDRTTLETYIARAWVRPLMQDENVHFEDIDVARAHLVHHLHRKMNLDEEAIDIVLHLLDQVYGLREQMRHVRHAIERQPHTVRSEIMALLVESAPSENAGSP